MVSVAVVEGDNRYRNISHAIMLVEKEISVTNKAEALNEKAIPLLNSMEKIPRSLSFLFLRHMDPHSPYLSPPFPRTFHQGDWRDPSNRSLEPIFAFKRAEERRRTQRNMCEPTHTHLDISR